MPSVDDVKIEIVRNREGQYAGIHKLFFVVADKKLAIKFYYFEPRNFFYWNIFMKY